MSRRKAEHRRPTKSQEYPIHHTPPETQSRLVRLSDQHFLHTLSALLIVAKTVQKMSAQEPFSTDSMILEHPLQQKLLIHKTHRQLTNNTRTQQHRNKSLSHLPCLSVQTHNSRLHKSLRIYPLTHTHNATRGQTTPFFFSRLSYPDPRLGNYAAEGDEGDCPRLHWY